MKSGTFRSISAVVTLALLLALILVINLVAREHGQAGESLTARATNPASVLATATEPSPTPPRDDATPPHSTTSAETPPAATETAPATDTAELAGERTVPAGGFSFRPVYSYTVVVADDSATLRAPDADAATGPFFVLRGGTSEEFAADTAASYVRGLAQAEQFEIIRLQSTTVNGVAAWLADIQEQTAAAEPGYMGRLALLHQEPSQLFIMIGVAPPAQWDDEVAPHFAAVLDSVRLLPMEPVEAAPTIMPTPAAATPVTSTPTGAPVSSAATPAPALAVEPAGMLLSNANDVNDLVVSNRIVWTATDGGIVAWNQQNGSFSKFTTLDGLTHNVTNAAASCDMEGLGVVFGSPNGLQIFSWEIGGWRTLNSSNSPMAFDDVAAIFCDVEREMLLVGYLSHGLDMYDVANDTWTHMDRDDGLASNLVTAATIVGDPPEIWAASGFELSVLRDGEITIYNAENSPLGNQPITALTATADGVVWLATDSTLYRAAPTASDNGERNWTAFQASSLSGEQFPTGGIVSLAAAPDGTIWLGSVTAELCQFDAAREECTTFFRAGADAGADMAAGPLTNVQLDADGNLYYTTAGNGYSQLRDGTWQTFALADEPLLGNQIHDVVQDADGVIWLATNGGVQQFTPTVPESGLYDFSSGALQPFDSGMLSEEVFVLEPDTVRGLWLGADAAGHYDGETWEIYTLLNGLAGTPVQAIEVDTLGRAWIGTSSGLTIAAQGELVNLTRAEGLPSDNILALLAVGSSDDSTIWIGTDNGLLRLQRNEIQVYNQGNANLPSNRVPALAEAADGALLVGTDRGLVRLMNGQATQVPELDGVSISALAADPRGGVWAGTTDQGLYYFDGAAWQRFTPIDGLPSLHIAIVFVDSHGIAWVGGANGGLTHFYVSTP